MSLDSNDAQKNIQAMRKQLKQAEKAAKLDAQGFFNLQNFIMVTDYVFFQARHAQVKGRDDGDDDDYNNKTPCESEEEDEVVDPHPLFPPSVCIVECDIVSFNTHLWYISGSVTWHILIKSTSKSTPSQRLTSKTTGSLVHYKLGSSSTHPCLILANPW
jgi:hypothetical protein